MRATTKFRIIGIATVLAFMVGWSISRGGGRVWGKIQRTRKQRALNADLAKVLGEKARLEEELRQMEGE